MKVRKCSALYVVATGVVVVLVTVVVLFWARWGCETTRYGLLPEQGREVVIDAPGFIKTRAGRDPNAVVPLRFVAAMRPEEAAKEGLGIPRYPEACDLDASDSGAYVSNRNNKYTRFYYDRSCGVMVSNSTVGVPQPNGTVSHKNVVAYAGPEGVADMPDRKLGRFRDPLVRLIGGNLDRPIVYDRGLRRFFAIDWQGKAVRQGPPLADKDTPPVVDFGWPRKQPRCLYIHLDTQESHCMHGTDPDRAVVLDAAGHIQMLDLGTLAYTGSAGWLPAPATVFPSGRRVTPDDLFAFQVQPVFVGKGEIYAGCAVAALSRDATAMKLEVFDANGASVALQQTGFPQGSGSRERLSTVRALYIELPGAAALTATKFVLESLHPPVLLWLSYFTASDIEAVAGHRSLLVLPDSFAAMKARDAESWWLPRFVAALLFLLPGLAVSIVLARLVGRHGRRAGMSVRTRRLWMAATILFGIPAYVTYQITRPQTARVTCQNCGHDRWVDWEKCHHCGSPWIVPELTPPAWRVVAAPEEACDQSPAKTQETTSEVQ